MRLSQATIPEGENSMSGEWQHKKQVERTSDSWMELPWVIALGFVLLWLPGALLAWRYPYESQVRRRQARLLACTVVIPWVGGALYLAYFLVALLVQMISHRD